MSVDSHVRRLPTLNESLPAAVTSDLYPYHRPHPSRLQIKAHSHLHADTMLAIRARSALQSNVMRARSMSLRRARGTPLADCSPLTNLLRNSSTVLFPIQRQDLNLIDYLLNISPLIPFQRTI